MHLSLSARQRRVLALSIIVTASIGIGLILRSADALAADPYRNSKCGPQTSSCTTCAISNNQYYCMGSTPPMQGYSIGDCLNYSPGALCSQVNSVSCGSEIDCVTQVNYGGCYTTDTYCQ